MFSLLELNFLAKLILLNTKTFNFGLNITSLLLKLTRYEPDEMPCRAKDQAALLKLIGAAFAMRRKKLTNNLKASFGLDQGAAVAVLERAGLDANVRGEALQVDQLCAVANEIHALRRAGSGR